MRTMNYIGLDDQLLREGRGGRIPAGRQSRVDPTRVGLLYEEFALRDIAGAAVVGALHQPSESNLAFRILRSPSLFATGETPSCLALAPLVPSS